ncbi:uncharacterized protein LOC110028004 isoform X2 [Phalaenopsis equestris]|uniref:uncharacterized protein LOC110028004 isoform X2 n=1 Tax=Phalaenopsis equestris TaxID=78828 RepID=UPI0009E54286|nr:uncharacterized protein LOC110028004 isoform X2 [Phalaenopsis equestris]
MSYTNIFPQPKPDTETKPLPLTLSPIRKATTPPSLLLLNPLSAETFRPTRRHKSNRPARRRSSPYPPHLAARSVGRRSISDQSPVHFANAASSRYRVATRHNDWGETSPYPPISPRDLSAVDRSPTSLLFISLMPRHPDIGWQHGTMIGEKRHHVQCNYCHRIMIGGITRFKKHLASKKGEIKGCDFVPRDVRDMMRKQLVILKPKKGIEKKRKRAIVGCSVAPSSGDHAIDPNSSSTSMNVRHDLLSIDDMGSQELGSQQLNGTAEDFDAFSNPAFNENGSAPHRATDVGWDHGTMVNGDRQKIMCRYCQKIILGGGISRLKQHLAGERGNIAPCEKVPDYVKTNIRQHLGFKVLEKLKRQKITEDLKVSLQKAREEGNEGIPHKIVSRRTNSRKRRAQNTVVGSVRPPLQTKISPKFTPQEIIERADMAVAKFFYITGVTFNSVDSFYFQKMIDAITAIGPGYKIPSHHSLRGNLLNKCLNEASDLCKEVQKSWEVTGCTIMADRWIDKVGHAKINFYAYSPKGTIFLKSVDESEYENSPEDLSNLFDCIVKEVGSRDVVAFLTDSTPTHRAAARILMKKYQTFFSFVCAKHCFELMLKAMAEMDEIKDLLAKVKKICQLLYNNAWILNSFRKKTEGKELFQPAATEFVTKFSTLQTMVALKDSLQQVFISISSVLSEQKLGSEVIDILSDLLFWSSCARILKVIRPLLSALHRIESKERPNIGYFYDSVEKVRKGIVSEFENESDYRPFIEVIDRIREELHSPLHAAAHYLNPSVYYSSEFLITTVIQKGLLDCIETLETNMLSQDNITRQKCFYEDAVGDFSRPVAVRGRETLSPDYNGV